MLNQEIVSFRSCVCAVWLPGGIGTQCVWAGLFPFPFWSREAFPFPFWFWELSLCPSPPNLLSNFSWAHWYIFKYKWVPMSMILRYPSLISQVLFTTGENRSGTKAKTGTASVNLMTPLLKRHSGQDGRSHPVQRSTDLSDLIPNLKSGVAPAPPPEPHLCGEGYRPPNNILSWPLASLFIFCLIGIWSNNE